MCTLMRFALFMVVAVSNMPLGMAKTTFVDMMPKPSLVDIKEGSTTFSRFSRITFSNVSEPRQALITSYFSEHVSFEDESAQQCRIQVHAESKANTLIPSLDGDESYILTISDCEIKLHAKTEQGILRGIQTLRQLVFLYPQSLPLMRIADEPRFKWRGLLIDSVRHFLPLSTIKRQIDGMAAAKLNVLHWHLTDDQGWRIETKAFPKLHLQASDNQYYSHEQVKSLVHYAAIRGIRVVPEFDFPGHASAIAVAYPELITKKRHYDMQRHWGVFEPLLDPSNPGVYDFINQIITEMAALFPDPFVHIGGDEVNPIQWQQSEQVKHYMTKNRLTDSEALQAHFNQKVNHMLANVGKHMMGWDEIFHPALSKRTVIQSWRGLESLMNITREGYRGVLSTGFYLDQPQYAAYHYRNEPIAPNDYSRDIPSNSNQWQFSISRLKGSPVEGVFSMSHHEKAQTGWLQFNGKPARVIDKIYTQAGLTHFALDSWMGPLQFTLDLADDSPVIGRVRIGNTPYPIEINKRQCDICEPVLSQVEDKVANAHHDNVLGGEAAIWTELVTADNIDIRVWPRLLVIAERLWSDKSVEDEADMYRRMELLNPFLSKQVGLLHLTQQFDGFTKIAGDSKGAAALKTLSEAVEPAHYYTRHHLKYRADEYHQHARLDRYADFLPAQSMTLITLGQYVKKVKTQPDAMAKISAVLNSWRSNLAVLRQLDIKNDDLRDFNTLVDDLERLLNIADNILKTCAEPAKLRDDNLRAQLWQLAQIRDAEVVMSSALLVESLMDQCLVN